ncbi:hypothetical protein [Orenia metallireducens]|nr:hypothetical protein [Orenia metallireducens]
MEKGQYADTEKIFISLKKEYSDVPDINWNLAVIYYNRRRI